LIDEHRRGICFTAALYADQHVVYQYSINNSAASCRPWCRQYFMVMLHHVCVTLLVHLNNSHHDHHCIQSKNRAVKHSISLLVWWQLML